MVRPRSSDPTQVQLYETVARAATLVERERCAKIAETCGVEGDYWRRDIAAAIRAAEKS